MKIGFTCSAFDLLHAGHVMMLEECRTQCDKLIVGLQTDPTIDRPEKNKPVQSLEERRLMIRAVRWVDEIVEYKTEADLVKLLKSLKPHVRFLGADWKGKRFTGDELDIEIVFNSRVHSYSTSELRHRVYLAEKIKKEATQDMP